MNFASINNPYNVKVQVIAYEKVLVKTIFKLSKDSLKMQFKRREINRETLITKIDI